LPKNCIYYGVLERLDSSPTQVVVIERDNCFKPYNHIGDTVNVGYPKLLFAYQIKDNEVISSAVVAARDEFIKNESPVYHFPYGNVLANGKICWGTYTYPRLKELADLTFYPEPFYLLEHTHAMNAVNQVVADLLHSDKEFDDSKLVMMTTFKKFINKFCK
ncbi:MAG: prokaryotic E2 ligase family D protein, partial [Firmicutes bacterium]|nr:prokaryotic E2 ligase family D protein [Bacillota bacterium]